MPKKDVLKAILSGLDRHGNDLVPIHKIIEWTDDNYQAYENALLWLYDNDYIKGIKNDVLDDRRHFLIFASISSAGRDFLENNCELERPKIEVRLDDEQFQTLLVSVAERVGSKKDVSILKSFISKAGTAGLNAFISESVKLGIANLPSIMSKF